MILNTVLRKVKTVSIIAAALLLLNAIRLAFIYDVFYELSNLHYEISGGTVLAIVCIALAIVFGFFALLINVIIKNNV